MTLTALKAQARATVRNAGLSLAGSVFLVIGVAFLTVAAWIALADAQGTLVAALVIGGVYAGLGCIFLAFGSRPHVPPRPAEPIHISANGKPPTQNAVGPALVEALFVGISAGMAKRNRHH